MQPHREDSGLAGRLIETSAEVGGAIGIAVVATLAIARTDDVLGTDADPTTALTEGYHQASLVSALCSVAAAIAGAVSRRRAERPATEQPAEPADDQHVRELVTAD